MNKLLKNILFESGLLLSVVSFAQIQDTKIDLIDDPKSLEVDEQAYLHDDEIYIDSLKSWLSQEENDSIEVLYMADIAQFSIYYNASESADYSARAIKKADSLNSDYLRMYAWQASANALTVQGLYLEALKLNINAYAIEEISKWPEYKGLLINNIGDCYMELDDYENAYKHFQESLKFSRSMQDSMLETISMFNIGRVYKIQSNYTKALEYIYSSKLLSEKIGDTEGEAYSDYELGLISHLQGESEQAINFLESSIKISDSLGVRELQAQAMIEIADIKEEENNLIKALEYYYQALNINEQFGNQKGIAEANLGLGKLQIKMNSMESASNSLHHGLSISLILKDKDIEAKYYEALSMLYERKGDLKKSLDFHKLFKIKSDSVFNTETNMQVALMDAQFDSEKKDKEIAQFKESKARNEIELEREKFENTLLFGGMIIVLVVAIVLTINIRAKKKINDQLRVQKSEIEKKNKQLGKLNRVKDKFFSIISHDLKSPFQSLSGVLELMSMNALSDKEIKDLFKDLKIKFDGTNDLLENLLSWAKVQMKETSYDPNALELQEAIDDELQVIQGYKAKNIELENKVNSLNKVYADVNMLRLVIRNLVGNAVKFTNQKGKIEIISEDMGEFVCVSIKDNGVGIRKKDLPKIFNTENTFTTPGTELEKGTGLGLSLCKEFVEMNGGKIWVESEEGRGSTFKFTLKKAS